MHFLLMMIMNIRFIGLKPLKISVIIKIEYNNGLKGFGEGTNLVWSLTGDYAVH